jgi:catechol 2,3-dioxygenase-like lactoylglutathione lyase family enzyme
MPDSRDETGPELCIHHLALRAGSVDVTAAFYREVFGLAVVRDERPRSLWLGLADGSVLMIEARCAGEPGIPLASCELFALRVFSARKEAIKTLARARGCFDGETEHTVYLRDPDGRRVAASTYPLDCGK